MTDCSPPTCLASRRLAAKALGVGCLLCCVATFNGCANTLSAREIPPHLAARRIENAQTIDLSRLAANTVSQELITPGDVIAVAIAAGLDSDGVAEIPVRVGENGIAELPHIGQVRLAGLEFEEAEAAITTRAIQQGLYTSPHVTVTMRRAKTNEVTVLGAVEEPGTVELRAGASDLLRALSAAGSLSEEAGTSVTVRLPPAPKVGPLVAGTEGPGHSFGDVQSAGFSSSGGPVPATPVSAHPDLPPHLARTVSVDPATGLREVKIDLASAARNGRHGFQLPDGAVVNVEKADPMPLHVLGLVNRPDRYDYPVGEELRLLDAIALAGGESNPVANKIFVIRQGETPSGKLDRQVVQLSLNEAKRDAVENILLMPGDIVTIEKTPGTVLLSAIQTVGFGVNANPF